MFQIQFIPIMYQMFKVAQNHTALVTDCSPHSLASSILLLLWLSDFCQGRAFVAHFMDAEILK